MIPIPQNIFYPEVFYPRDLEKIFEEVPETAQPNLLPVPTSPELPPKPSPPGEFLEPPPKAMNYRLLGVLSFVTTIVSGAAFAVGGTASGLIVSIALILLLGGVTLFKFKNYSKRLTEYRQREKRHKGEVNQYHKLLMKWEKEKQKILEQHHQKKQEYEQHNKIIKQEHQAKIDEWRLKKFREQAQQLKPSPLGEPVDTKRFDPRGYAEINGMFPRLLYQYFGDKIYSLYHISGTKSRIPDFAYIDSTYPLSIDIEIDEPYTPRQYPNSNSQKTLKLIRSTSDRDGGTRLNEVLSNDWFVIVFSERQVLKEPHSCCKVVANLIDRVTGSNLVEQHFQEVADLTPDLCWSKEEAKEMANRQERLNY